MLRDAGVNQPSVVASPFNLTGSPAVVLPIGRTNSRLPIGLQLVGARWADMRPLAVAQSISDLLAVRSALPGGR